ncbi:hypothetical protein EXW51_02065 [Bacillus mycoides]|nr:hypothetical protein EXW61_25510 [Bacillus mycoides]QWH26829.1 hypothetical protein EXW51_02065 [Bacillus mycoides]QWI20141.1 hypothetical protein EXW34_01690 [Bacillus mycoides]
MFAAHLRLPYVNIFIFQCQPSFFISFVAFCVVAIGDLSYITPQYSNRQHLFIKKFNLVPLHSFNSR